MLRKFQSDDIGDAFGNLLHMPGHIPSPGFIGTVTDPLDQCAWDTVPVGHACNGSTFHIRHVTKVCKLVTPLPVEHRLIAGNQVRHG